MSDIDGKVTGIQGVPVSDEAPNDGYILTYVDANNQYEPKARIGLRKDTFLSNGTWLCPPDTYLVILIGCGGGGGGASNYFGAGGGSFLATICVDVVPGTTYTITIGAGGIGGASVGINKGGDGYNTTFGSLATFIGAAGGGGTGGGQVRGGYGLENAGLSGCGGGVNSPVCLNGTGTFAGGNASLQGYSGGDGATDNTGGGGGGPGGVGGNATSGSGGSAASNTGAGGAAGNFSGSSNAGGDGGSGFLHIIY